MLDIDMTNTLSVTIACFILASLPGCAMFTCSYEEIGRASSPDGLVDAVWVQGNCGATTAYSTHVFLVPVQTAFTEARNWFEIKRSLLNADHVSGLKVRWVEPQLLSLGYREARIHHFTNVWSAQQVQDFRYVVELRLDPQSATFSVPDDDRHWR